MLNIFDRSYQNASISNLSIAESNIHPLVSACLVRHGLAQPMEVEVPHAPMLERVGMSEWIDKHIGFTVIIKFDFVN